MKKKVKVKEADDHVKAIAKQNERYERSLLDAKTKLRQAKENENKLKNEMTKFKLRIEELQTASVAEAGSREIHLKHKIQELLSYNESLKDTNRKLEEKLEYNMTEFAEKQNIWKAIMTSLKENSNSKFDDMMEKIATENSNITAENRNLSRRNLEFTELLKKARTGV